MAAEFDRLVKERGVIKGQLTRQRNFFDNKIASSLIDENVVKELETRLVWIESIFDEYNLKQSEIESVEMDQDNLRKQEEERDMFESSYFSLVGKIKSKVDSFYNSRSAQNLHNSQGVRSSHASNHSSIPQFSPQFRRKAVELPAIKLPNFNGKFQAWIEFRDGFKALVDDNAALSDVQKFYYLRSCLSDDALALIESIQVTDGNYKIAWDLLNDRFEQKNLLIHSHIRDLFEFPALETENHASLRTFFDTFTKNLRALQVLGEDVGKWDRLLIYLLTKKLDKATRREWELFEISGDLPTMADFNKFLKQRCDLLEKLDVSSRSQERVQEKRPFKSIHSKANKGCYASTQRTSTGAISCYFCKDKHSIFHCEKFLKLTPSERWTEIRKMNLCRNCIRPGHDYSGCMHSGCKICNGRHNTLVHNEQYKRQGNREQQSSNNFESSNIHEGLAESKSKANQSETVHACSSSEVAMTKHQVLLSTAIVKVKDSQGKLQECRALLDCGSQSSFVTENLCKKLNLAMEPVNFKIVGIGQAISKLNYQVHLDIYSCTSEYNSTINCLVLEHITDNLPSTSFSKSILNLPKNIQLADHTFNQAREIDILIGASLFWDILQGGKMTIENSEVILQETSLGWVLGGVMSNSNTFCKAVSYFSSELSQEQAIDNLLLKFWEVEEVQPSSKAKFSDEEQYCEDYFIKTVKRASDNRFIVSIPFKENLSELGDTREYALQRYLSQERKLSRNSYLKSEYDKFMLEYIEMDHMSEVDEKEKREQLACYLPHHPVVREHSKTTKVRVVFDASMKSKAGLSLNDVQYIGPTLQDDLFSIVLRFRKYEFVMTADISKMYRMILVNPEQRSLQRIFWRQNAADELKCYQLNTVTYGTASAPYLSVRSLIQLAIENENTFPKASESIRSSFYMDDYLEGANSEDELLELQSQVTKILASAGFELRKWMCNKKYLLSRFQVDKNIESGILKLNDGELNKTLGIVWDSESDSIQYLAPDFKDFQVITKRVILSAISQIYDPLGLLGPIVIVVKLLMQSLWQGQFGWDEELPQEFKNIWLQFKGNLEKINAFKLPRMVTLSNYVSIELHGFGDASQRAYGCCLYIRCQVQSGQYSSRLLCAKSRVAPIKKLLTLPRLELCASLLLAQLSHRAIHSLQIRFDKCYFYSDSQIALSWIKGSANKWKLFVANRVSEIQQLTDINDWYHVATDQNPADLISRGISVNEIVESSFWWEGPCWLKDNDLCNHITKNVSNQDPLPELKAVVHTAISDNFDLFSRFSSLSKLTRVFAYILRFTSNCRLKTKTKPKGFLTSDELQNALEALVGLAQQESFPEDYNRLKKGLDLKRKSKLLSLNPIFKNGVIRVGGRLQKSNYDFDKKFPMILAPKHPLTRLILIREHQNLLHCGPTMLLASVRERFWPISGRNICKRVVRECIKCFRIKPNSSKYIMGELPNNRVTQYLPFVNTGTDFAGPFLLKDRLTRGAKLIKCYVCIFICLSTKAIHLEVMSDLSTSCFLSAFRRFVGRRGKPSNIYSDNGKTYIGADRELQRLGEFVRQQVGSEVFHNFFSEQNICWHFIPARAPNFGGIWEAGVKSFKFHFKRVVGEAHLNMEDFHTVLVQIESILNSRPLCPLATTPDQLNPLTPAHFLLGRSLISLPDKDVMQVQENRLKRFERLQQIIQHFWLRWKREYLAELQVRTKWKQQPGDLIKEGDVVVVVDDQTPTLKWPLAKVEKVHPGSDNVVRVVTVRINNKLFKRPVSKLCILPIGSNSTGQGNN